MKMKIQGQEIFIGTAVYDLAQYTNYVGFIDTPTPWLALKYLVEEHEGGIPLTNETIEFEVNGVPSWGFDVIYIDATHFRIQYRIPDYDFMAMPWEIIGTRQTNMRAFNESDPGIDRNHITEEDFYRYPLYMWEYTVTSAALQVTGTRWGWGVGFFNTYPVITGEVEPVDYLYDEDFTPPRFIYNGGIEYYFFTNDDSHTPIQNQFTDYAGEVENGLYVPVILLNGEEITSYTDDTNSTGGGYGDYNFWTQNIGVPGLPSISIIDTGMASMWVPDPSQTSDFADFLWSSGFIDNVLKLLADPLENVIQFGTVPISSAGLSSIKGTNKEVKVGNVGTGVQMTPLTTQYIQIDMGSISNIRETWGTVIDYEPCTKIQMFIPFVGVIDLTASEVMNGEIGLYYNIDLFSGDFACFVTINKLQPNNVRLKSVMYHKTGNLMVTFPLTEANYGRTYRQTLQSIIGVAGGMGSPLVAADSLVDAALSIGSVPVERSGSYTGAQSALGCFTPYIILTQSLQQLPSNYNKYEGYPSYSTYQLKKLKGFTVVESVIDNTVSATDTEKKMIEELLKGGIII